VFDRNNGGPNNWGQGLQLNASDGTAGDEFGSSVSINGDTVVVGAWVKDSAYVFERDWGGLDNWGEVAKLTPTDGTSGGGFGFSVSISGDTVVVGRPWDDVDGKMNQGSADVFYRNEGGVDNWGGVEKLNASDGEADDYYGYSVSIDGDTIIIGANRDDIVDPPTSNQGSAYIYYIGYVNTPPTITTIDTTIATEDSLYSQDYDATDPDFGDTLTWSISYTDTDGWLTIDPVSGVLSGTPDNTDVGSWIVNVTVDDGNGGIDWSNFTLDVSNIAPSITILDDTTADEDVLYSVDYASDDDGQGTITWSLWTDADFLAIDAVTGVLSGTPDNSDIGSWIVNVTVDDGNGGIDWSNFTLDVRNIAPIITTDDDTIAYEDLLDSVDYASDDDGQGTLTWSLWTDADFLTIDAATGVLSGTPDNSDIGSWIVNITVHDGNGGIDWSNFTLVVSNIAPSITTADDTTADEDVLYSVDYASDDDGNGTITWSLWTDADFLSIDAATGVLSGTPDNSEVGSWIVNITVDDGNGGIDWSNFTLVVSNVNDAPVIDPVTVGIGRVGAHFKLDINATDIDPTMDTLTWSVISNASWLSIGTSNGTIWGRPTSSGVFWANVTVRDGMGGSDWTNLTIIIQPDYDSDKKRDDAEPQQFWWIILIIIIVLLILALIAFKRRGIKSVEEEEEAEEEFEEEVPPPPPKKAMISEIMGEGEEEGKEEMDRLDLPEPDEEL